MVFFSSHCFFSTKSSPTASMPLFQNIGFKGGINANLWITLWFTRNLTWRKKKPWIWLILGGFLGKIIFFLENCCQAFQENPSLQALPTQNLIHQVSSIKVFPPNKLAGHIKKHLKIHLTQKTPLPNETLSSAAENLPKLAVDARKHTVDGNQKSGGNTGWTW